jgi:hypothetical protein
MMIFTEQEIASALRANRGIRAHAAKALGTDRAVVQMRVDRSPYLQSVIRDIEETTLDMVDSNIGKALEQGDMTTTRWYAELKGGATRGYRRRVDNAIDEDQLDQLVAAFGGDVDRLRALRATIAGDPGVAPEAEDQTPIPRED